MFLLRGKKIKCDKCRRAEKVSEPKRKWIIVTFEIQRIDSNSKLYTSSGIKIYCKPLCLELRLYSDMQDAYRNSCRIESMIWEQPLQLPEDGLRIIIKFRNLDSKKTFKVERFLPFKAEMDYEEEIRNAADKAAEILERKMSQ